MSKWLGLGGKSAIFAALNIGLGGKAKSNDRGQTIKTYVKEGRRYAQRTGKG